MKYCVVFGAPRSGTTYLQKVLQTFHYVETTIGQIVPLATCHIVEQNISAEIYDALAVSVGENIETYLNGEYNSRFRALNDWWNAPLQLSRLHGVLRRGARARPDWFIYKEPFLSLCPEFVWDALPDAKIIYIHRDGRDVANSLVQTYDVFSDQALTHLRSTEMRFGRRHDSRYVPWWVEQGGGEEFLSATQFGRAIWMWSYMVEQCANFFETVLPDESDRILRVPYEGLVRDPDRWGEKLRNHLDRSSTYALQRKLNAARTSSIGKHTQLPGSVVSEMEDIAFGALSKLEYIG
jgi:hypothetical protein